MRRSTVLWRIKQHSTRIIIRRIVSDVYACFSENEEKREKKRREGAGGICVLREVKTIEEQAGLKADTKGWSNKEYEGLQKPWRCSPRATPQRRRSGQCTDFLGKRQVHCWGKRAAERAGWRWNNSVLTRGQPRGGEVGFKHQPRNFYILCVYVSPRIETHTKGV